MGLGAQELLLILLIIPLIAGGFIVIILPHWKIFEKAGFSGWLGVTQIVPILNIIMIFYLAFSEWPVHRELNRMKQSSAGGGG